MLLAPYVNKTILLDETCTPYTTQNLKEPKILRLTPYALRNTQYAIRNTQYAICVIFVVAEMMTNAPQHFLVKKY